jgi:hypothetical protein
MGSSSGRSRLLIYALPFILITTMSTAVGAQGLFGVGFPGASYLDGFWRGAVVGCGSPGCLPGEGARVYVGGSADYAGGTVFDASTQGIALLGASELHHSYPNRGVWIGLTLPFDPGPRFGLYASAWSFLRTGNVHSRETYNNTTVLSREWQMKPYWTILEALAIFRCGYGCNILGGFRYDHYDITLNNPVNPVGVGSLTTDVADLNVRNFIPLIGTQYENHSYLGSLLFRAVGFPVLGGDVQYQEPFAGATALRGSGHYRRGYFAELFMEYTKKFGPGQLGLFARWNEFHAQSTLNVNALAGGAVIGTQSYDFSFNRSSWTLGGSVNLAFNLPY